MPSYAPILDEASALELATWVRDGGPKKLATVSHAAPTPLSPRRDAKVRFSSRRAGGLIAVPATDFARDHAQTTRPCTRSGATERADDGRMERLDVLAPSPSVLIGERGYRHAPLKPLMLLGVLFLERLAWPTIEARATSVASSSTT